MPTDEERCEVAAELRELAEDYEKVPAWDVIAAGELPAPIDDALIACGLGRTFHATEICGRLADLIEPEERTCRNTCEAAVKGPFTCSACGENSRTWVDMGFGDRMMEVPQYCPNCGARVIRDA